MSCAVYSTIKKPGISAQQIQSIVTVVLGRLKKKNMDVSVHCVGEWRMRTLNRIHRGVDRPTDVLSFPVDASFPGVTNMDAGDIFVCPSYLRKQAARFAVPFKEEVSRMIIHATLHLFGYDHVRRGEANKMFALQEDILSQYLNT